MACERCIAATLEVFASGRLLFVWMTETVLRGETRMFAPRDARWLGERRRVPRNKPFSPRAAGFGWLRDFESRSSRSFSPPAGARTAGGNRHDMGAGCGRCQEAARDGERAGALLRGGGGGSAARKRGGVPHTPVKPNSGSRAGGGQGSGGGVPQTWHKGPPCTGLGVGMPSRSSAERRWCSAVWSSRKLTN